MTRKRKRSAFLNPLSMLLAGLLLGAAARLFDIYLQTLGEIFSQMAVWILLGTLIAIYSPTRKAAMGNVFPFCMGMLVAYYATAAITHGVYSRPFIIGWTAFAVLSPVMAYFAWMTRERGVFPKIIAAGIVAASVMSSILLFDRLRVYDLIIDGALVYFLFFGRKADTIGGAYMNNLIACCGLDCEKCDARIATITDDSALRQKTAELWTKLNGVPITAEMINCTGCRVEGVKTPFCDGLCPIRSCVREKKLETCADCGQMSDCPTLGSITANNPTAMDNLKSR